MIKRATWAKMEEVHKVDKEKVKEIMEERDERIKRELELLQMRIEITHIGENIEGMIDKEEDSIRALNEELEGM